MYRNYIFDLYGTLIDIRTDEESREVWEKYAEWLKEHGMPYTENEVWDVYHREVEKLLKQPSPYEFPEIDILPVFEAICKNKKPEISAEEIYQAGEAFRICSTKLLQLYPNTKKVLQELKKAGCNVYLLSNAQRVFTWQELVSTGIEKDFDDIFISSDAGCKKPDAAFYRMLMEKHCLKPEECLMVGNDSTSDIAGAASVGIDALYLRTAISPADDPLPDCKYVFEDGDIGHVLECMDRRE